MSPLPAETPARPLDVLLIEDSVDDAQVIERELVRSGFAPHARRVETADQVRAALVEGRWDVVLTDHVLPDVDSTRVLQLCASLAPDLPLIVVSGAIGEEAAVAALRRGAADYVSKDHLEGLGPAVRHSLRQIEAQGARRAAEAALAESEERFRVSFENAPMGMAIISVDPKSLGRFIWVNRTLGEIAGLSRNELMGLGVESLATPEEFETGAEGIRGLLAGDHAVYSTERRYTRPDGSTVWVQLHLSLIRDEGEHPLNFLAQVVDLTARRQAEEARAHLAAIVESSEDAIVGIALDGTIVSWNGGAQRLYGYRPGEVIGEPISLLAPAHQPDELQGSDPRARPSWRAGREPGDGPRGQERPLDQRVALGVPRGRSRPAHHRPGGDRPGHHGAQGVRGRAPVPRRPRRVDRADQQATILRQRRPPHRPRQPLRARGRGGDPRPRQLQGDQRHARPRGGGRDDPCGEHGPGRPASSERHPGPPGRRRVRGAPSPGRRSRRRAESAPTCSRCCARIPCSSPAAASGSPPAPALRCSLPTRSWIRRASWRRPTWPCTRRRRRGATSSRSTRPRPSGEALIEERLSRPDRVRSALHNDGMSLFLQPIKDLRSGRISQWEALLRLREDGELILPGAFLGAAERSGLVIELDRWVVGHAIELIARQRRLGHDLRLEVNLSGRSVGDAELPGAIEEMIAEHGIEADRLIFEVTETAAIANMAEARDFAESLTRLGCRFALDDFGAGFGSFYYLKYLPLDYLKIDGDFIRKLRESEVDQVLVRGMVGVARGLGVRTIAEFVEDGETLDLLRDYGIDYAQGFHVGRPEPAPNGVGGVAVK